MKPSQSPHLNISGQITQMYQTYIDQPKHVPKVNYEASKDVLFIKGESTSEYAPYIYESVLETIETHFTTSDQLNLYLHINSMSTNSLKSIFQIFKLLSKEKQHGNEAKVIWFFDLKNQCMMDVAYDFSDLFNFKIVVLPV